MAKLSHVLLLGAATFTPAFSLPETCTGACTNSHDPSVITRSDGTYFRFSTGGKIAIHTAPSITGPWTYKGAALPNGSSINLAGNQDLWAPDINYVDGAYYLYYSVSTFGSQNSAIGVAHSTTMDVGTWVDLGASGVASTPSKLYNAIDANLLVVDENRYLTFGSFWNGLYQVPMATPPTKIQPSSASPYQVSYDRADAAQEGPVIFKNGDYYYLFFSKGSCCGYDKNKPAAGKQYRIMVCRSSSPTGGFVDKSGVACTNGGGSLLLGSHQWVYGPGGQGVYQDNTHGPVLYYHYVDTRVGYADGQKRFGWNKLDFSSGWPAIV